MEVRRREPQPEAVPLVAWEHVQVDVEDLLHRRRAVRQEQVHPLALDPAVVQRGGQALRHAEHLRPLVGPQVGQAGRVSDRDDQQVAGVDGLDVHERRADTVAVDEADFGLARQEPTEYAISFVVHRRSRLAT